MEREPETSQRDRAIQKLRENPFIPIGFVATCAALGMAFRKMHQRDSVGYQRWLRARVVAQGLTIVAIVAAGVKEWDKFSNRSPQVKVGKATDDQRAFQRRMQEAEEAHRVETLAQAGLSSEGSAPAQALPPRAESPSGIRDTRSSWLSWLGLPPKK